MKRIKVIRESRGLSQADVAKAINVSQSCVAKWESGGVYPRAQLLPQIARILDCTIDELFKGESLREDGA